MEGMRTLLFSAVALATLASSAHAQTGTAVVTDFPLVKTEIVIADAAGTAVKTLSCEWREPEEDDMPCIRFQGDPQTAFEAIEAAGGVRADQVTTLEDGQMTIARSRRADGTWLIRSKGTVDGKYLHFGRVCTADGQVCTLWDADGGKYARKSVKAAAAKLRNK
jgi:hypothetical protein